MSDKFRNYSPDQARQAFDKGIPFIDIREPEEFEQARIPGARLLPMSELNARLDEIPNDKDAVVYCRSGNRSAYLLGILSQRGYLNLVNLAGGIIDWYEKGYPVDTQPAEENYRAASFKDLGPKAVRELIRRKNERLHFIDVRENIEFDNGFVPGSDNIPLSQLPSHSESMDKDDTIVLICNSGNRSAMAANWLSQNGFRNVVNVEGGIYSWHGHGYPVQK